MSDNNASVDPFGHPRIPHRGYYDRNHCDARRAWVERFHGCSLEECGQWWLKDVSSSCEKLKGNLENPIGLVKVPLGVCGPLLFDGEHVKGYILCPFASTEGALVASISRGATALTRSGGVYTKVLEQTQIRSPLFRLRSIQEVDLLTKWVSNKLEEMRSMVHLFSQHANLKEIVVTRHGRVAVTHFKYTTGDACGQNMTTSVTSHLCKWILSKIKEELPQIEVLFYSIESLLSGDKCMTFTNLWKTRGFHVQAEAWIPEDVLKSVLKVDVSTIIECYQEMQNLNSGSGRIGFGLNVANLITGMFIATGQDVASIESSTSHFSVSAISSKEMPSFAGKIGQDKPPGIYVTIALPSLNVGTVGGGTSLATQKECLQLIGCYGTGAANRLCEIIAGYALSLEVSTLSAAASGQFASAHEKLGRNHPTLGLKEEDMSKELFSECLGSNMKLMSITPFKVDNGNSILSEITKTEISKKIGHFGFTLKFLDFSKGNEETIQVVLKAKTTAMETCNVINKMAQACGLNLATEYQKYKMDLGFNFCDIREVEMYKIQNMRRFFPKTYHTVLEPSKDIFVIIMEYLSDTNYTHLNSENRIEEWRIDDIKIVLRDLAQMHSVYFYKTEQLELYKWIEKRKANDDTKPALWIELLKHAQCEFPKIWPDQRVKIMENAILNIDKIHSILAAAPQTLVHNDCNPRNLCLRKTALDNEGRVDCRLCLYDWELATIDVPQRDLVEFLAFTIPPSSLNSTRLELIDFYRCNLEHYSGITYPLDRFCHVFNATALDYAIRRLLMYTMAHTFKNYMYLPRVVDSLFVYIEEKCLYFSNSKL